MNTIEEYCMDIPAHGVLTQDGYCNLQTGNTIYRVPVFKLNFRWEGVIFFFIKITPTIMKA